MQFAERTVILAIFAILICGVSWLWWNISATAEQTIVDVTDARPVVVATDSIAQSIDAEQKYFPNPVSFTIGTTLWRASIANTLPTRIKGLSNTPFLPPDMVKWFDFETNGPHSIWMKDMQYSLDIVWLTREGEIVHVATNVSPDTYPTAFSSPVPAWYVLEANVGFLEATSLKIGDIITPPKY